MFHTFLAIFNLKIKKLRTGTGDQVFLDPAKGIRVLIPEIWFLNNLKVVKNV
jgi:hypothetical protein